MKFKISNVAVGLGFSILSLILAGKAFAVDEEAAKALARQNKCTQCHAIDKKKDGPAFKEVAAKYRGKKDAEERLIHHITSGEKAKFEDGHE